jgi:tetratricopeptide (TPR) repeat protein
MLVFASLPAFSQQPEAKTLQETAKTFTRQGDYSNAIMVLTGAVQKEPQNLELQKDLAFNYYLQRDYPKGLNVARPLTERPDADVQCYQIAGMLYMAIDESKECERLYKAGIKKFPQSGVLYNEYGEMLFARQDNSGAIKQWEKGIEVDPAYSSNYYNASRYYYFTMDKIWSILYGEIFVNLESYSKRTAEIKDVLLESYKKLYTGEDVMKDQTTRSPFALACLGMYASLKPVVAQGVTTESLILLRTKFVLGWFAKYPSTYPFRLFEYQRQLLKDGMFDAYNQWIFGAAENLTAFQNWSNSHGDEYKRFVGFQQGRVFKLPEGQYYQTGGK